MHTTHVRCVRLFLHTDMRHAHVLLRVQRIPDSAASMCNARVYTMHLVHARNTSYRKCKMQQAHVCRQGHGMGQDGVEDAIG